MSIIFIIALAILLFACLCWTGYLLLLLAKRNQQIDELRSLLDSKERSLREIGKSVENYQQKVEAYLKLLNTQTNE
jgi:hypothetical protein